MMGTRLLWTDSCLVSSYLNLESLEAQAKSRDELHSQGRLSSIQIQGKNLYEPGFSPSITPKSKWGASIVGK